MKISVIDALLASVSLPPLSRDQLLAFASCDTGKAFAAALRHLEAGNRAAVRTLSLVVRAHSRDTHSRLREMGFHCSETELAQLAIAEDEPLLGASQKTENKAR